MRIALSTRRLEDSRTRTCQKGRMWTHAHGRRQFTVVGFLVSLLFPFLVLTGSIDSKVSIHSSRLNLLSWRWRAKTVEIRKDLTSSEIEVSGLEKLGNWDRRRAKVSTFTSGTYKSFEIWRSWICKPGTCLVIPPPRTPTTQLISQSIIRFQFLQSVSSLFYLLYDTLLLNT